MRQFWQVAVQPILRWVEPQVVLEIGSDAGGQTRNLAEFCRDRGCRLHVVDPRPRYSIEDWERRYGDVVTFHVGLSLEVLPNIEPADAVLLDGDHNWYTVYHELRHLERTAKASGHPFPIVVAHDVGWPYGRRDLYYDPDTIPEEGRQPHARGGVLPDEDGLVSGGGLNPYHVHALFEGGPRNGVLTAFEDFLRDTSFNLEFYRLTGMYGLGVLLRKDLEETCPELAGMLRSWILEPHLAAYVELLEASRVEREMGFLQKMREAHQNEERAAELKWALGAREDRDREVDTLARRAHELLEAGQAVLQELRQAVSDLRALRRHPEDPD